MELSALFSIGMGLLAPLGGSPIQEPESTWTCNEAQWVGEPGLNSRGEFDGTLAGDCVIESSRGSSLNVVFDYILSRIPLESEVNQGPVPVVYDGMPGYYFDVLQTEQAEGETIRLYQDVNTSTDGESRLAFDQKTRKIEGSGVAGYLKMIAVSNRFEAEGAGKYKITTVSSTLVKKPPFVPGGYFVTEAMKGFKKTYERRRDATLNNLAKEVL